MKQEITKMANILDSILTQQGVHSKNNAIYQTLTDFETSTANEMERDFQNNDFSDLDDLSRNLKTYQFLKKSMSESSLQTEEVSRNCSNQIMEVYDYYESKYIRELDYRNSDERKNYIETILSPLMLIHLYFKKG